MESATKALEMAFAVFVFVMALSLSVINFSKVRQTADTVLKYADVTAYYDYAKYDPETGTYTYQYGEAYSYTKAGNRIVGFETVIPTLYKYNRENYTVVFKRGSYDSTTGEYSVTGNLEVYKTTTNPNNWNTDYTNDYDGSGTSTSIYKFDINEETKRHEPWVGSATEIKKHLDAIFGGEKYYLPQYGDTSHFINYNSNKLNMTANRNKKFIEEIGRVQRETTGIVGNNTTSKTIITYIQIN